MKFDQLVNPDDLRRGIEDRLITVRIAADGQRIFNYSDAAIYTPGAWGNPAVRQCRGLIVDPNGGIAARPWGKFFNHGQVEAGALDLDAPVQVTDKLDGSLGILHYSGYGGRRVATRGSFESEQAIHATERLRRGPAQWPPGFTPLVEIIYPGNRIVVNYGQRDELVLLGGVWINSGEYVGPQEAAGFIIGWDGGIAETFEYSTLREALAAPPRPGMEGLCVRYLGTSKIVKVKQAGARNWAAASRTAGAKGDQ